MEGVARVDFEFSRLTDLASQHHLSDAEILLAVFWSGHLHRHSAVAAEGCLLPDFLWVRRDALWSGQRG